MRTNDDFLLFFLRFLEDKALAFIAPYIKPRKKHEAVFLFSKTVRASSKTN